MANFVAGGCVFGRARFGSSMMFPGFGQGVSIKSVSSPELRQLARDLQQEILSAPKEDVSMHYAMLQKLKKELAHRGELAGLGRSRKRRGRRGRGRRRTFGDLEQFIHDQSTNSLRRMLQGSIACETAEVGFRKEHCVEMSVKIRNELGRRGVGTQPTWKESFIASVKQAFPLGGLGGMCECGFKPPHLIGMSCATWCKGFKK